MIYVPSFINIEIHTCMHANTDKHMHACDGLFPESTDTSSGLLQFFYIQITGEYINVREGQLFWDLSSVSPRSCSTHLRISCFRSMSVSQMHFLLYAMHTIRKKGVLDVLLLACKDMNISQKCIEGRNIWWECIKYTHISEIPWRYIKLDLHLISDTFSYCVTNLAAFWKLSLVESRISFSHCNSF